MEEDNTNTNTNNKNNDSVINGLKFGQKIYFEDSSSSGTNNSGNNRGTTSSNVAVRSSGGNNTSSYGGSSRRGVHGGGGQQQNVPRCQVEGCQVDLSDVKAYYSRHKVCCMHSKSPKVVVSGLEQRFCQQCSRFHQLPEFDQGKRSCRRRLAGHNERRRKLQPGSMFSRFGRLPSTIFDNSGQTGGFLLDFTAPTRLSERDAWPHARPFELVPGNESAGTGSSFSHSWQSNSDNSSTNLYLRGSSCAGFSSSRILPGECFTGVAITDSTCALSLLSNQQQWGSRNSSLGANNMAVNAEATSVAHPTGPHGMTLNQYPNPAWGFKADDQTGNTSNELCPDLGLSQISQPLNTQFPGDPELSQQSRRQYSEMEPTRAYDPSNQNMHWSL